MSLTHCLLAFFLLCVTLPVFAQNDTVRIRGSIADGYTYRALSGVSIINPKSSISVATDSKGFFETTIHRSDTLFLFLPGYRTTKFSVADSVIKSVYVLHLYYRAAFYRAQPGRYY